MRWVAGLFGVVCGAVVVTVAARYGFKTSDNDFDGYVWAFMFGAVSLGGLFGHALGVRVWRLDRIAGAFILAGSVIALVISLSNSLGAMAGRGNEAQAKRIQVADNVRDTWRSLKRAEEERERLKFTPADETAVRAAKSRAEAATRAKDAECTHRGPRCREKEEGESGALAHLETATRNKGSTDRAAKLDTDIADLREKIEKAGPVLEANSQGSAFARMFGLPDTKAAVLSTWQNFAMAITVELLIVLSMIAFEVLGHAEKSDAASGETVLQKSGALEIVEELEGQTRSISATPKPRLIASSRAPFGSVPAIMAGLMEPGRGKVEFAEALKAYAAVCRQQGKRPVAPEDFGVALKQLCDGSGIKLKSEGEHVFLMRVQLKREDLARQVPQKV